MIMSRKKDLPSSPSLIPLKGKNELIFKLETERNDGSWSHPSWLKVTSGRIPSKSSFRDKTGGAGRALSSCPETLI